MQETAFGVPLILITCWIAYGIKILLAAYAKRGYVSVREFLRLASGR
jgi:hypothetical protein